MIPRVSMSEEIDAVAAGWVARRDLGLSVAEEAELEAWLNQDARHAAALARFEATWSAVGRPRRVGAAAGLSHKLRVLAGQQRRTRLRATGAALAALTVFFFVGRETMVRETTPLPAPSLVVQRPEQRTLPDGSTVELKSDARIEVEFTAALRRVRLLSGEALFAVTKDPSRPFVVAAGGVEVRAVGTAFAVQLRTAGVEVLVTEGRVSVNQTDMRPPPAANAEPLSLEPPTATVVDAGSRVVVDLGPAVGVPQVMPVVPEELLERLAWRAPRVEFSGTPLAEVVQFLNRHHASRFVIADETLARVQLSGNFRVDDAVAFIRMLEVGFGIEAESRGDTKILLRRAR